MRMLNAILIYTLLSVFIVSLISFIGVLTLSIKVEKLKKVLIYLISFSAGALLADAFIHLLPELIEGRTFTLSISLYVLLGIVIFFVLEKIVRWHHYHMPFDKEHEHPFAYMNLVGDGLHNFIDGLIIAGAYMLNFEAGIATTIAVVLHEIPQEIGDFGVLIHGGFSKAKALLLNFASALMAVFGAAVALALSGLVGDIQSILVPVTIGGFIYIAGSDLIPELHKESHSVAKGILQTLAFILGILVIAALLLLE